VDRGRLDWLSRCLLAFQHGEVSEGSYSEDARLGALWHGQLQRVHLHSMTKGGE